MAKKPSVKSSNLVSVVSFVTLLVILASVFVLSGSFSDFVTTINKPKASQANPKVTESFADAFKDGAINEAKWVVTKSEGVAVAETTTDNLRIGVSAGSVHDKVKSGSLTFKELIKDNGDFRALAVVYKPIVTGEGTGVTALRFSSKGTEDKEAAAVRWVVKGSTSRVSFVIVGADGKRLETEQADIKSNVAVLRLDRINKKYRAFYKVGSDVTGDTAWKALGSDADVTLGNEGFFSLSTHNGGVDNKFPQVVGRIDQVNIGWEGDPKTSVGFSDAFANDVVGKQWKVYKTEGAQVYENANDNLIAALSAGGINNKPRSIRLVRTIPVVPENKDFVMNAGVLKPVVVGKGQGQTSLGFVSTGSIDDEAAALHWVVSGNTISRLVFVTRGPDGTLVQRASVDVPVSMKRLTLRLSRTGDKYTAMYRTGDNDSNFVSVGNSENSVFGAAGHVMLSVNNIGANNEFPRVIGRFDEVTGHVNK